MTQAFIMVGLCMAAYVAGYLTRVSLDRIHANDRRAESFRLVQFLNVVNPPMHRRVASLRPAARWRRLR